METIRAWLTNVNDFCDFWNYRAAHDVFSQETKIATVFLRKENEKDHRIYNHFDSSNSLRSAPASGGT